MTQVIEEVLQSKLCLEINYDTDMERVIEAGRYKKVMPILKDGHFPSVELKGQEKASLQEGIRTVSIFLLRFEGNISWGELLRKIKEMNLRTATFRELLAIGVKYPKIQLEYPIFAYGSSLRTFQSTSFKGIPYLYHIRSRFLRRRQRVLGIEWVPQHPGFRACPASIDCLFATASLIP